MLLTITLYGQNTVELGYLLHKNPYRPQKAALTFGSAYVFYPELSNEKTTAALLLEIDPLDIVRGKEGSALNGLFDYVNDRPYVSSSFLSVAIAKVFGTAMTGRADKHQALSDSALELEAKIAMLPCRSDPEMLNRVFEPLGYKVNYETFELDENFASWGKSKYVNLTIKGSIRLRDLLKHIYVLVPVFDRQKHYWVGKDEVEKLLRNTEDWLPNHPENRYITSRYLKQMRPLVDMALSQLLSSDANETPDNEDTQQQIPEEKIKLNDQRLGSVVAALKNCKAKTVIDIGCGEGKLLLFLAREKQFTRISGTDVSHLTLERASETLKRNHIYNSQKQIELFQSSVTYKDQRFKGYDAAVVIEVIEHLDLSRLAAFERVLFEYTKPSFIILTTPNRDYNVKYENITDGNLRHRDHRFEWSREEFRVWAQKTADRYGYTVKFSAIGDNDETYGAATQMGVFTLCE